MNRVYHHYELLEEFKAGMWKRPTGFERKKWIEAAADLMRCRDEFGLAMMQALELWPMSCEHNLTSLDSNRIAWLGQAGCCIATGAQKNAQGLGGIRSPRKSKTRPTRWLGKSCLCGITNSEWNNNAQRTNWN